MILKALKGVIYLFNRINYTNGRIKYCIGSCEASECYL
jgi:hypothetical protein